MTELEKFLRELAPYVVVVGSFGREEEHEGSDIDCFLRAKPLEEIDYEDSQSETYMPEIIAMVDRYGFEWSSVIVGHIAVERQPGVPRMVEISTHYSIPYTNQVFAREIYGVKMLCAKDDKNTSLADRYDCVDWDDVLQDTVIRHPLPEYAEISL